MDAETRPGSFATGSVGSEAARIAGSLGEAALAHVLAAETAEADTVGRLSPGVVL
jgi:hypothetical protein